MPSAPLPFAITLTRATRALGLEGKTGTVRFDGDLLVLAGDAGGEVAIPLADIARIRLGKDDVKYGPLYEMRLWRGGEAQPVVLHLLNTRRGDYAAIARTIADAVARRHGMERVERGLTAGGALFAPLLMLPVVIGAIALSLLALEGQPWWGHLLVPAVPTLLLAFLLWRCFARQYPRAVTGLAELDRYLP